MQGQLYILVLQQLPIISQKSVAVIDREVAALYAKINVCLELEL